VEPPSLLRYLIGSAVMMIGVVLPVGYMMFRNKREQSFDLEVQRLRLNSIGSTRMMTY
ncbi:unnamed protein product, partial [Brassica oleracea var. botrytis]